LRRRFNRALIVAVIVRSRWLLQSLVPTRFKVAKGNVKQFQDRAFLHVVRPSHQGQLERAQTCLNQNAGAQRGVAAF